MGVTGFAAPVPLGDGDSLEGFRSGLAVVDEWAAKYAAKARQRGSAVVYVSRPKDGPRTLPGAAGFYTLSSHSVARAGLAGGWLRRNAPADVPVVLLGMLGVDSRYQGNGLGRALLRDAIERSCGIAEQLGAKALVVQPADEGLLPFYAKAGFSEVPGTDKMAVSLKRRSQR